MDGGQPETGDLRSAGADLRLDEIGEGGWLVPCKDDPQGAWLKAIRRVVFGK
jgi:hypothetical protein